MSSSGWGGVGGWLAVLLLNELTCVTNGICGPGLARQQAWSGPHCRCWAKHPLCRLPGFTSCPAAGPAWPATTSCPHQSGDPQGDAGAGRGTGRGTAAGCRRTCTGVGHGGQLSWLQALRSRECQEPPLQGMPGCHRGSLAAQLPPLCPHCK